MANHGRYVVESRAGINSRLPWRRCQGVQRGNLVQNVASSPKCDSGIEIIVLFNIRIFNGCFVINQQDFWNTLMKKVRYAKLHFVYHPGDWVRQDYADNAREMKIYQSHIFVRVKLYFGVINFIILCVCLRKFRVNRSGSFCFIVLQNQSPRLLLTISGRRKFS